MSKEASARRISGMVISAPEWFQRDDFCEWIKEKSTATWCDGDSVNEYSDVFTIFENGAGPDEMAIPKSIWDEICDLAHEQGFSYGLIWIKPV